MFDGYGDWDAVEADAELYASLHVREAVAGSIELVRLSFWNLWL